MTKETIQNQASNIYKTERYRYSTTSSKGIFVRVVYRFRSERTGQPFGIQLSVNSERRVKMTLGVLNNDNVIVKPFEAWNVEIVKIYDTISWCVKDFYKNYPEYKYYILN